eukprot:Hpha_TRINITY_DN18890_c0_g1::TRINITY_DN18890_c0_g1_i1::g.26285::m.26285
MPPLPATRAARICTTAASAPGSASSTVPVRGRFCRFGPDVETLPVAVLVWRKHVCTMPLRSPPGIGTMWRWIWVTNPCLSLAMCLYSRIMTGRGWTPRSILRDSSDVLCCWPVVFAAFIERGRGSLRPSPPSDTESKRTEATAEGDSIKSGRPNTRSAWVSSSLRRASISRTPTDSLDTSTWHPASLIAASTAARGHSVSQNTSSSPSRRSCGCAIFHAARAAEASRTRRMGSWSASGGAGGSTPVTAQMLKMSVQGRPDSRSQAATETSTILPLRSSCSAFSLSSPLPSSRSRAGAPNVSSVTFDSSTPRSPSLPGAMCSALYSPHKETAYTILSPLP